MKKNKENLQVTVLKSVAKVTVNNWFPVVVLVGFVLCVLMGEEIYNFTNPQKSADIATVGGSGRPNVVGPISFVDWASKKISGWKSVSVEDTYGLRGTILVPPENLSDFQKGATIRVSFLVGRNGAILFKKITADPMERLP